MKLVLLWTTGQQGTIREMLIPYTLNSKLQNWWDDVTLIIWGSSTEYLKSHQEDLDFVKKAVEIGINVEACKACSDNYGMSELLEECGVDVRYMGQPLTDYLQSDVKVMTI